MNSLGSDWVRKPRSYVKLLIVAAFIIAAIWSINYFFFTSKSKIIPAREAEKVLFTVYAPSELPPGYTINNGSYTIQDGALIFSASNAKGSVTIDFSEQSVPPSFDFTAFYQQDLHGLTNIQGVPYPSVTGLLPNGNRLLSVEAKSTWLLITADTPLSESTMRLIASSIQPN